MLHTRVDEGAPRRLGLEELHTMVEDGALGRQGAEEAPRTLVLYKLEELHMMALHRQGEDPPHTLVPHKLGELHMKEEGAGAPHTPVFGACCIYGREGRGSYSCAWCGQCGHP